jgi:hypothetical protein
MPWIALGIFGLVGLMIWKSQHAAAPVSPSTNTTPVTSLGVNLDAVGPGNTGMLGVLYMGAIVSLSYSQGPVTLGNAAPQTPGQVTLVQTSGPPVTNCPPTAAPPSGPTWLPLQLCGLANGAATLLAPGSYSFAFTTPSGAQGSFSFVVIPATAS